MKVLPRKFYMRDTRKVARDLLGKLLVREISGTRISGVIVETEAYRGFRDTASHAHKGPTERCKVMFGRAGFAYVYLTYGIHNMFNLVTERVFYPAAVLVRAIQPIENISVMALARDTDNTENLTSGPGKLTKALHIDRTLNGIDVTKGEKVWVEEYGGDSKNRQVGISTRVGIDYADDWAKQKKWRYYIVGSGFLSKSTSKVASG
jgi:DNA-3-methyladenine glycosylase